MRLKKRRKVKENGCMREINQRYCDIKLKVGKRVDFSCKNVGIVAYFVLSFRYSFGVV